MDRGPGGPKRSGPSTPRTLIEIEFLSLHQQSRISLTRLQLCIFTIHGVQTQKGAKLTHTHCAVCMSDDLKVKYRRTLECSYRDADPRGKSDQRDDVQLYSLMICNTYILVIIIVLPQYLAADRGIVFERFLSCD